MKKFVKFSIILMSLVAFCVIFFGFLFVGVTIAKFSSLELDKSLITSPMLAVEIFDEENRPLTEQNSFNKKFASLEQIPLDVKNAFIAIEDQKFFSHHGLNYKRIVKAGISNLLSGKLKEGASTISQQLVKNTHLSSEKTFERKLKEVVLTKKLEKNFSKNQILESYLNAIYYGNNCYGIEEAANYYFSKPASELSLEEGALLAGMIKSPNNYSPILKQSAALKRRNLVLSEMQKCGFLNEGDCFKAQNQPIKLNLQTKKSSPLNSYGEAALDEACKILNVPAKDIAINGYQIHTYLDKNKQDLLEKAVESQDFENADHGAIVIDCKKHAVSGFVGESAYKILDAKRQPGSCIKPILCYAPALNEDLICPETQLLDEQLCLGDYCPKNVDGKFRGYISATDALAKSINIPAIKVLSYVGIDKAKAYAEGMGVEFDEGDNSFALALGGMKYGVTLLSLAESYTTFACDGKFANAKFVEFITDKNGKLLYSHHPEEKRVLREDCSFLLTTMLQEASNTGTAKILGELNLNLACKTGTVGKGKNNSDAWCVAYSPSQVCAVWAGNLDNEPISIVGGNQPAKVIKKYFSSFPREKEGVFTMPNSVVERDIDLACLENLHVLKLASPLTKERFRKKCLFSIFNLPEQANFDSSNLLDTQFAVKNTNGKVEIEFDAKRNLKYTFFDGKTKKHEIVSASGTQTVSFDAKSDEITISTAFLDGSDEKTQKFLLKKEAAKLPKKWFV